MHLEKNGIAVEGQSHNGLDMESFVEEAGTLGSLPSVFYQINEAVEDPEASFAEIGQIISRDSGLSARLLRVVNSSYFGFSSRVETITHAVTIVGMVQLRDLALATAIIDAFKGLPKNKVNMASFWHHSIAAGLAARAISVYVNEPNPERFYVLGLLHDIGRLLLYLGAPDAMSRALQIYQEQGLLYEAERKVLGWDHAEVGGALLSKWHLPPRLAEGVRWHHNPSQASRYPLEAAIVHVADIVAHTLELGNSGEHYVPPMDAGAWQSLGLPSSMLSSVVAQVDRQAGDVVQAFL